MDRLFLGMICGGIILLITALALTPPKVGGSGGLPAEIVLLHKAR